MIQSWDWQLEDWSYLDSLQDESEVLLMRGEYQEQVLDPDLILRHDLQYRQGSCAGHSLSTNLEWVYGIATGGQKINISRAMAYYETQRIDGIRGDSGSTISGGIRLAKSTGICEEQLWQYPERYDNTRPRSYDSVLANAAKYKVNRDIRITSYEGARTWLGSGQGGIHPGYQWSRDYERSVVETVSRRTVGGHSEAIICLSERKDSRGRPYLKAFSSYPHYKWHDLSPSFIEQILRQRYTVFVGLSDMPNIQPREFTAEDWVKVLRW